jgi:hypothetical protein
MLRSPLAVRVANANFDTHITRLIDDIEFSTAAPGGFDTCSFEMAKPIFDSPEELAVESRVYVYDTRNGRTIWEGKLTDPGRSFDEGGHKWSMTAMGPKKHASDRFSPYIAIDSNLEAWLQVNTAVAVATVQVSGVPGNDNVTCLLFQFPAGIAVGNGDIISAQYNAIAAAGQHIGSFRYTHQEGFIPSPASDWQVLGGTRIPAGGDTVTNTQSFDTATRTIGAQFAGPDFSVAENWVFIREKRNAIATNVVGDKVWVAVTAAYVIALLFKRDGNVISGASSYPVGYLTADLIVTDILVRFCPLYDAKNALIDTSTYQIDQFAYPTAARPSDMFDDLSLFHPDKRFCAWETNPATGLYKVEWTGWGTQPRYEATTQDGIDLPGSSTDLYSRVTVQGTDPRGQVQSRVVETTDETVLRLLDGLEREAEPIDLGSEVFSTANADRVGNQFLSANNTPPASGTLTVKRAIRDLLTGRIIQPWEIRAGSLIRVRGLSPTALGVTASDRDGATVFRVAGTSFRDSDQTASLTLDSRSYSIEQILARLARRRQRH